jgi:hypothetical protein
MTLIIYNTPVRNIENILTKLNSIQPQIEFTMEKKLILRTIGCGDREEIKQSSWNSFELRVSLKKKIVTNSP